MSISGALVGLDNFDLSAIEETNDVGGGGAVGAQGSGFVDPTGTFTVDENPTTAALFVTANGRVFDFVRGRAGNAAGARRERFSAVLRRTHTFEARGKRRFTIACEISGPVTVDTF